MRRFIQILLLLLPSVLLILVALNAPPWLLLLLLLILIALLLWWFWGDGPEKGERPLAPSPYPPEEFYIQNQVIVRGPRTLVGRAIANMQPTVSLDLVKRLDFSELDSATQTCLSDCSSLDFADFVIDLYELGGTQASVAAAIAAINRAVGRGSAVGAEPNWLSGQPWEPTGSPWEPTGSPWEPTGSGTVKNHDAPSALFLQQWAFAQIGLPAQEERSRGRGVRIGVFDTSPFIEAATVLPAWVAEPTPLTLALAHYPTPIVDSGDSDLSSHGLFVAGLAHAVAPEADMQLIQVLGKHNKGDLFSLNLALFDFIKANAASQRPTGQLGAVINLSLGIRVPPAEAGFNLPAEVQSLRDMLRVAQCAQIMVVAAAGNNSANLPQPEAANLPANWPEILGVAGSSQSRTRSCFSNVGDVAAPGGNGRFNPQNPAHCMPANDSCGNQDCVYALVGPVLKTELNSGFVYWSGTSFATPLVAGLAALVIEKGNGNLSPQAVRRLIECAATPVADEHLGKGIIHVANTLARFEQCAQELGILLESGVTPSIPT